MIQQFFVFLVSEEGMMIYSWYLWLFGGAACRNGRKEIMISEVIMGRWGKMNALGKIRSYRSTMKFWISRNNRIPLFFIFFSLRNKRWFIHNTAACSEWKKRMMSAVIMGGWETNTMRSFHAPLCYTNIRQNFSPKSDTITEPSESPLLKAAQKPLDLHQSHVVCYVLFTKKN